MGYGFDPSCCIAKILGQQQQSLEYFWRHWASSYLLRLALPSTSLARGATLQPGDQVLIHWIKPGSRFKSIGKLSAATVIKAFPGNDGIARRYEVRGRGGAVQVVPWSRLYLGEVDVLARPAKPGVVPQPGPGSSTAATGGRQAATES